MKRMKVLFGNRRMMVMLTLAILVLAAAALIASSASFTSSANVQNTFTAGDLTAQNGTLAFDNTDRLWPGDYLEGTVGVDVIANGGPASLWLRCTNASVGLGERLQVEVLDGATQVLAPTSVTALTLQNGVLIDNTVPEGSTTNTYTIRVYFTDGDAGPALSQKGADNPYQGAPATLQFQWVAVSE